MNTHVLKASPIGKKVAKGVATSFIGKLFHTYRDLATVSVSVTYTTKSNSTPQTRVVDLNLYARNNKGSKFRALRDLQRNELRSNSNMVVYDNMGNYRWKVIWLNEMGEEQFTFHESEAERNAKLQALVDDGYSPVFREVE